jgi:hypothetical protein
LKDVNAVLFGSGVGTTVGTEIVATRDDNVASTLATTVLSMLSALLPHPIIRSNKVANVRRIKIASGRTNNILNTLGSL